MVKQAENQPTANTNEKKTTSEKKYPDTGDTVELLDLNVVECDILNRIIEIIVLSET